MQVNYELRITNYELFSQLSPVNNCFKVSGRLVISWMRSSGLKPNIFKITIITKIAIALLRNVLNTLRKARKMIKATINAAMRIIIFVGISQLVSINLWNLT